MNKSFTADTYGKCVWKKQVSQRPAPTSLRTTTQPKKGWYNKKKAYKAKQLGKELRDYPPLDTHFNVLHGVQGLVSGAQNAASDAQRGADLLMKADSLLTNTKRLLSYKGTDIESLPENLLARLEDFAMLVVGLSAAESAASYMAVLHLFIRTYYTSSVGKFLWQHVLSIHELPHSDSGDLDTQSFEGIDDFLKFSRSSFSSWKDKKNSHFASKLTDLVSMLVACGFMGDSDLTDVKIGHLKLFKLRAFEKQMGSSDFFEMVFDTVLFFIERGYAAIKEGDISLLFHSDRDSAHIDSEYSTLVAALPLVETGDLDALGDEFLSDQEYSERVEKLIRKISDTLRVLKDGPPRTVLANKLVVLKKLRISLMLAQKNSPVREKPYGVAIFGGSSVGKSAVNAVVMKVLLAANGFPSTKEYIVTLNDNDKFQSEYKGSHTGVTFDDHGNTKSEHYSESPCNKIIDFLNNVQKAALNPNVELKGNIMIRPKVVTLTTNVKGLLANTFSNEPVSILRRFNVFLDIRLRPEYVDPETGGLNSAMMTKFIEDAWIIDVQRVFIVRGEPKSNELGVRSNDTARFVTLKKDVSLCEALEFMKEDSGKHFMHQQRLVRSIEKLYDTELCPHCHVPEECPFCEIVNRDLDTQSDFVLDECDSCEPCSEPFDLNPDVTTTVVETVSMHDRVVDAVKRWYKTSAVPQLKCVESRFSTYVSALEAHKEDILKTTLIGLGITGGMYAIFKLAKCMISLTRSDAQSSVEKAPELLQTDVPNPWKKVVPLRLFKSHESRSTPSERLINMLSHHLGHITVSPLAGGSSRNCVCVPIGKNDWIVPAHVLGDGEFRVVVQTTKRDQLGKNFTEIIDNHCWVPLGPDFVLLRLVKGGDVHNFAKYLMTDDFDLTSKLCADLVYKDNDGNVSTERVTLENKRKFTSKYTTFEGVDYHCSKECFPGMCMSPLIACKKGGTILGFHLAGRNGTSYGVSGILTRNEYDKAVTHLNTQYSLVCHSTGEFPESKFGIDFQPVAEIDKRHPVRFQEGDGSAQPTVEVIGAHGRGTARFKSQVRKLPISDSVNEIMGLPRLHGPPNSQCINKHWSRDLTQMAHPQGDFIPRIWRRAVADLDEHVDDFFRRKPSMIELVHPYPKDYVLSGMDGVTSVDRVDLSTSMGWPINKAKKNFIGPVEREVKGVTEPVDFFEPEYWSEVERMRDVLASGERVFTIHRGNLKDEPTKYTKDKIRVFAGCEFVFTCLVRQYYLPIIRLIQTNWVDFECAVGINCHSKQWGELYDHITKHGTTNMIAGDYKAFDKSATPQAMMSAFRVLIEIAKRAGYTHEQLVIMQGIATEICYPVYELNGVFVKVFGSNPSGHPLTVIVNNLMNSLYLRYAYYAIYDKCEVPQFSEVVSLMCYGDDNAMGVDDAYPDFNHTKIAEELAAVGITYTMAEKDAESVPFVGIEDISFLKRGFKWNSDLESWTAPIEVASLSKSLHNYMHRKGVDVLPSEIAADSLRNANMEFFYHGKDEFLKRRTQLLEVARISGLEGMCTLETYEDLCDNFLQRKGTRPVGDKDIPLDVQSGLLERDLLDQAVSDFDRKPILRDAPFGAMLLGCPDLIFHYLLKSGGTVFVCIETKVLSNRAFRISYRARVVREQCAKYSRVVSILQPRAMVIGLTLTEFGYSFCLVCNSNKKSIMAMRKFLPLDDIEFEKLIKAA